MGIEKHLMPMGFNEGVGQYTLFFDNVEVAADQVVGKVDMGALVMFNSLNPERILAGFHEVRLSTHVHVIRVGLAYIYINVRKCLHSPSHTSMHFGAVNIYCGRPQRITIFPLLSCVD